MSSQQELDRRIIELWRLGVRHPGELARRLAINPRRLKRRVDRLLVTGAWPFEDQPVFGRPRAPVAPGFMVRPLKAGSRRPGRGAGT